MRSNPARTAAWISLALAALVGVAHAGEDPPALPPQAAQARDAHDAHAAHAGHDAHAGHAAHADHAAHARHDGGDDAHAGHDAGHALDPYGAVLGGHHHHGGGASYAASLGVIVADYDSKLYTGDYQGVMVGGGYARGRFAIAASLPAYRLEKNGKSVQGTGDVMLHGHASLVHRGPWSAGIMMMASVPTGDDEAGLGMGHVMLMPELWAGWRARRVMLSGAIGYGRALGGAAAHAEHGGGMWPLVDPMNASELTYSAGATVALAHYLGAGLRLQGAAPLGDGDARLSGSARLLWAAGPAETSVELQRGLVGDPFGLRALVGTTLRWR